MTHVIPAVGNDWTVDYLDSILSVKALSSVNEAVEYINELGGGHSEASVTVAYKNAVFQLEVK